MPRPESRVSVEFVPPDTVEMKFRGHVSTREVEIALDGAKLAALRTRPRFFVLDATDTTGYDADVRRPGVELLKGLRELGVGFGVCIAPSSPVRMIGAAVAFVAGLPVKFVEHRVECEAALSAKRRE